MWKWFKWVLLALGIILIGVGVTLYCYYYIWMKMNQDVVKNAENAIRNGVTISDSQNDFVIMGTNKEEVNSTDTNNPSPYRLNYLDIKSVSFGADEKYFYYKETFWATIPKRAQSIEDDHIQAIGAKAEFVDDQGKEYGGTVVGFGYVPVVNIPALDTQYFFGPTGIEWPESARYTGEGRDGKAYGGGGYDYIMGAFPLEKFGIKYGDKINIRFPMEVKSDKFSHAAVDVLQGNGKSPSLITWVVGSNQYMVDQIKQVEGENINDKK